jgi:hypothetical protein
MIAYNEGFLDRLPIEQIAPALQRLAESVQSAGLALDTPRDEWKKFIADVLEKSNEANAGSGGKISVPEAEATIASEARGHP